MKETVNLISIIDHWFKEINDTCKMLAVCFEAILPIMHQVLLQCVHLYRIKSKKITLSLSSVKSAFKNS